MTVWVADRLVHEWVSKRLIEPVFRTAEILGKFHSLLQLLIFVGVFLQHFHLVLLNFVHPHVEPILLGSVGG